jgi:solute carrier family 15 oligopeptide transporter 1
VELALEPTYAVLPRSGESQLRVYNGMNCNYTFQNPYTSFEVPALGRFEDKYVSLEENKYSSPFTVKSSGCPDFPGTYKFEFQSAKAVSNFLRFDQDQVKIVRFLDDPNKSRSGFPTIRVLANINSNDNVTIRGSGSVRYNDTVFGTSRVELPMGDYDIFVGEEKIFEDAIFFRLGGVYTLVINEVDGKYDRNLQAITDPNSVHMLWLIPQYVVLTLGEVMFSITGLQFSFTQAPESMKSVLIGSWHFTIGFGNLIVILITSLKIFDSQAHEFFLFGGLMFVDMAIFSWLAYRYKPIQLETLKDVEEEEAEEKKEKL